MAKAKKYTHIGNVGGDASRHIVRTPVGQLVIVHYSGDRNWHQYSVGPNAPMVYIDRSDPTHVLVKSAQAVPVTDIADAIALAKFLQAKQGA